ncbi:MAG TPA: OmpA family protein, partial [Catalimonadaceae bacterium]|nr:OmpA family protein [Catalimonadaceae bacterium]
KELAKANEPLMENEVNELSEDSSATKAAEADRIAKKEEIQNNAVASSEAGTKGNFEVKVLEEDPSASTANGQGYYMYDPMKDLQTASAGRKETAVRILVLDTDTRIPLDGDVVFIDQDTKEKITPVRVRNGVYEIMIANATSKNFMVAIEKEGFHFKNIMVNVPPASRSRSIFVTRNIELKRHTLNKPRILRNVYFDFDQAEISDRSNHELDMLYKMLTENDKLIIEVSGHADFLGEDDYNNELSKKRAEKVVAYLTSKGIDKGRLRAMGYGEKKPAPGTDSTENGRALNRRTEFMIMAQ